MREISCVSVPPNSLLQACQQSSCKNQVVTSFSSHKLRAGLWVSQHRTSQNVLLHRISHLSLLPPPNNSIWCTQPCPVSAFSCLPLQCSQRRLCGHRGGSGDHICASCSKESVPKTQSRRHLNWPEMQEVRQDVYAYFSYVKEMSYPPHFQLLVFYSALGTLFSSVILAKRTELSSPFPKLHLKGSLDELWI